MPFIPHTEELVDVPYCAEAGHILPDALAKFKGQDIAALVVPQPNFFGVLEPVDELTDWAHANNALLIAAVNPMALAILKPPGAWGAMGADIAVGDGQPLGIPLASGGPYFGFMACRKALLRQMPGRLVGATLDAEGKAGYVLTLQAREQHIRRSKATPNICTNQGLMMAAATLYMALLVCATETKNAEDLRRYTENMARIVGKHFRPAPCALKPSSNKI